MTIDVVAVRSREHMELWREMHNAIIPAHPLSSEDVRERLTRNRLILAYAQQELVGNATVRPGNADMAPTVIVRISATHRRRGYGTSLWERLLDEDPALRIGAVATVVLTANDDGLRFAERLGFVESERYEVDGAEYADLIRSAPLAS